MITWKSPTSSGPFKAEHAEVTFVLDNVGGQVVRILSIKSDCGCTKPVADPLVVEPGGLTKIVAKMMTPVSGRRNVPILVYTDSTASPELRLTAQIVSTRRPPFMHSVTGDLHFRGKFSLELSRDLFVVTFETGGPTVEPVLSSDLPFLKIQSAGVSDSTDDGSSADDSDTGGPVLVRTRRYLVGFAEKPPGPSFTGTIVVADPYHTTADRQIGVVGDFKSSGVALRVVPGLLTLPRRRGASGSVVVLCEQPAIGLECAADGNQKSYVSTRMESNSNPRRVHKIQVVVDDSSYPGEDAIRLTVRDPGTKASEMFRVHIGSR